MQGACVAVSAGEVEGTGCESKSAYLKPDIPPENLPHHGNAAGPPHLAPHPALRPVFFLRRLRDEFFRPLFGPGARYEIAFLAMTATMSADLLGDFSALTHVDWTDERHQMWASTRT